MDIVQDTVIVVPCYEEASRLDLDAFSRKLAASRNLRLVFVDDGSTDDTANILTRFAGEWPDRALLLILPKNVGKAEAVRRGMLRAFELRPSLVGYWDADLATPLDAIDSFALRFQDPALRIVMGSRIRRLGAEIHRLPWRHYLGRVVATVAAGVLRLGVYDTQCGAKLFRATPAIEHVFSEPFELNWLFDVELLARLQGIDTRILTHECVEMALEAWADTPGSKLTSRQFHRIASELARLPSVVRRARTRAWCFSASSASRESADPIEVCEQYGE